MGPCNHRGRRPTSRRARQSGDQRARRGRSKLAVAGLHGVSEERPPLPSFWRAPKIWSDWNGCGSLLWRGRRGGWRFLCRKFWRPRVRLRWVPFGRVSGQPRVGPAHPPRYQKELPAFRRFLLVAAGLRMLQRSGVICNAVSRNYALLPPPHRTSENRYSDGSGWNSGTTAADSSPLPSWLDEGRPVVCCCDGEEITRPAFRHTKHQRVSAQARNMPLGATWRGL